jgi:hypothetical protein
MIEFAPQGRSFDRLRAEQGRVPPLCRHSRRSRSRSWHRCQSFVDHGWREADGWPDHNGERAADIDLCTMGTVEGDSTLS